MNDNVLVSVLMPVYNGEKYLSEAIESILNQTYRNFEFIIVDDGSTDHSSDIIKRYADLDSRIIYKTQCNSGVAATLNTCIRMAQGKYWIRMDADDVSYKKRIEKQVSFMEAHEDIGVSGACVRINGRRYQWRALSDENIKLYAFFSSPFAHPTVIMRAEIFQKYNLRYDEGMKAEDYDLWVRCIPYMNMGNLREPLLMYRIHNGNVSAKNRDAMMENNNLIRKKYCDLLGIRYDIEGDFFGDGLTNADINRREEIVREVIRKNNISHFSKCLLRCCLGLYINNQSVFLNGLYLYKRVFETFNELSCTFSDKIWSLLYIQYRIVRRLVRK